MIFDIFFHISKLCTAAYSLILYLSSFYAAGNRLACFAFYLHALFYYNCTSGSFGPAVAAGLPSDVTFLLETEKVAEAVDLRQKGGRSKAENSLQRQNADLLA